MKFLHTKKGKIVMNFIYGIGASIVIVGAMFKIMHWPGANEMLIIGLSTEALIFAISAFDPPAEDLDWTLVYPELAGLPAEEDEQRRGEKVSGNIVLKDSITQELDKMLAEAKIGPELLESLGESIKRLSENTNQLADISRAGIATDEYVKSVTTASKTVSQLSDSYVKAAESLTVLTVSNEDGLSYGEQIQRVSKNLSALNNVYELQISGSQDYLEATSKVYSNIAQLLNNLSDSLEDTKRYKTEIAKLGENLSALNTVYGNMLSAMNIRPQGA
jgi:gliding motility-associated protein GldL